MSQNPDTPWWRRLLGAESETSLRPGRRRGEALRGKPREKVEPIILDDRERASNLHLAIKKRLGVLPRIERLQVGDVLIRGRMLVERKTCTDFEASVVDGRLFRQLAELREQPFEPLMILEGRRDPEIEHRLSEPVFRATILTIQLQWRIPILFSESVDETAAWIGALAERSTGGEAAPDWRGVSPMGRRVNPRGPARPRRRKIAPGQKLESQTLAMLCQIDGLGKTKARALLDEFGSVSAVVAADHESLARVEGIGSRLAARIRLAVGGGGPEQPDLGLRTPREK